MQPFILRSARLVSWLLHPFVLPLYVLAAVLTSTLFVLYPLSLKIYLVWVVALYTFVIPLLALGLLCVTGRLSDFRSPGRGELLWPMAVWVVCCIFCAVTLTKIPSAVFLRKFLLAEGGCALLCMALNGRWNISLFMTAAGAVVAAFTVMNLAGAGRVLMPLLLSVAGSGLLASARLCLGRHNGMQVLWGFSAGFVVAMAFLLFV